MRWGLDVRSVSAAVLYPLLTVACGDEGNGVALVRRGSQRGIHVDVITVHGTGVVPAADVYLLGGGSTFRQLTGALSASPDFFRRVRDGVPLLAVDAGLDAVGHGLTDEAGRIVEPGLGLLDVVSVPEPLSDGPVVTRPQPSLKLPAMHGWVSHRRSLRLGPKTEPLADIEIGPPGCQSFDGARTGRILGTRIHGPLLARNPEVADVLLAWAVAADPLNWGPLPSSAAERARAQRVTEERRRTQGLVRRRMPLRGWRT